LSVPSPLEGRLGYRFRNQALLRQALTHPSSGVQPDNQRLEYLGDALLRAALSRLLYREKPAWNEGALSKLQHLLESTEALCAWGEDLDLELLLPPGVDPRRQKTSFRKPLADAVEALLAALYLDAEAVGEDGFAQVCARVEARFTAPVRKATEDAWKHHDAKTQLQEEAARRGLPAPVYTRIGQEGPDHAPRFRVRADVGPHQAEAVAGSLKLAQAEAARAILRQMPTEEASPRIPGNASGKIPKVRPGKVRP